MLPFCALHFAAPSHKRSLPGRWLQVSLTPSAPWEALGSLEALRRHRLLAPRCCSADGCSSCGCLSGECQRPCTVLCSCALQTRSGSAEAAMISGGLMRRCGLHCKGRSASGPAQLLELLHPVCSSAPRNSSCCNTVSLCKTCPFAAGMAGSESARGGKHCERPRSAGIHLS